MTEHFMKEAIKEAKKALKFDEIPVGAVIVKNNKIIARAYNIKEKNNDATKHAEIIAISKACKKINNWRLDDCTLYVTMEPCMMCCGAIEQSRIKKIVYGIKNENYGSSKLLDKTTKIVPGICEKECLDLVQSLFKKIR